MSNLRNFLDKYRISKKKDTEKLPSTHTMILGGSWHIPVDKLDNFYGIYNKSIKETIRPSLTERFLKDSNGDYLPAPICIDFDMKYPLSVQKRPHDRQIVEKIIDIIYEELFEIVDFQDVKETTMIVFEKPHMKCDDRRKVNKDGIHFMMPYLLCSNTVQMYLREKTMKKIKLILEPLPLIYEKGRGGGGKWEKGVCMGEIYDLSVSKFSSGWMMPGSAKPDNMSYDIVASYTLDEQGDILPMNESYSIKDLSIHKSHYMNEAVYKEETLEYIQKEKLKSTHVLETTMSAPPTEKERADEYKLVLKLLEYIDDQRSFDYHSWIVMGMCLYNINKKDNLPLWIDFSRKAQGKFKEGVCEDAWKSFKDVPGPNISTLKKWAIKDSNSASDVMDIIKESDTMGELVKGSIGAQATHHELAIVIHKLAMKQFIATDKSWYSYNGVTWTETHDAIDLRRFISTEVRGLFTKWQTIWFKDSNDAEDTTEAENAKTRSENCAKVYLKLGDASFKDKVIKECKELFHERDFLDNLDENPNLIAFENFVYDLKQHRVREGYPEDYISMSTGYKYPDYLSESDEMVTHLKEFLRQILPQPAVRKYTMLFLSSCLGGSNPDESFNIWTGGGGNGKSKLTELFGLAAGDYACNVPVSMLTQKRNSSSAANPELARTKGKRFCSMQEPDDNCSFNLGLMKELTGNDTIQARTLFKEPMEFKPQFKLVMMCNQLPSLPTIDNGTMRRLKVTEFIATFKDKPDHNAPKERPEFKIDRNLNDKLKLWGPVFMWKLLDFHKEFSMNGNTPPDQIIKASQEYQAKEDIIQRFFNDGIIHMDPENPARKMIQTKPFGYVFRKFKLWCETIEGIEKSDIPKQPTFKEKLNKDPNLEYVREIKGKAIKYKIKFWDHTADDEELPPL